MTCKDCIHEEICDIPIITDGRKNASNCKKFKNKADFVEVVRCEKCTYGDVSVHSRTKDGQEEVACYCNLKNKVTDVDYYCPSGKRKCDRHKCRLQIKERF